MSCSAMSEATTDMAVCAPVIDALTALGYSIVKAQRAVQSLPRDTTDVEERLRRALESFGG